MTDSYYPWFPGDYLRDTKDLSLLEHGAYRVLLDYYYSNEGITSEVARLYRICGAMTQEEQSAVRMVVQRFFVCDGDHLTNKRADKEIEKRHAFLQNQTRKSQLALEARRRAKGEPEEQPTGLPTEQPTGLPQDVPLPSPSPSPSLKPSPTPSKDKKIFVEGENPLRLSRSLFDRILANNPKAKEPNFQTWAEHVDLMLRVDKRAPPDIESVIEWCQSDSFWIPNILSTKKLRDKFDTLYMQMQQRRKNGNTGRVPKSDDFSGKQYIGSDLSKIPWANSGDETV